MGKTQLKALVLAAGKGTRLHSEEHDLPKVLREAAGRPLLGHVLGELSFLPPEDIILVVGYRAQLVREAFPGYPCAVQAEQLGTGHAVMAAREQLGGYDGALLVCCGDMPLMRRSSYEALAREHAARKNICTLLSGTGQEPLPYGRIVRGKDGRFLRVVEDKDCTQAEREIRELNAGVYVFETPSLFAALAGLRRDNAQGEYYLTDVPALLRQSGGGVDACNACLPEEMLGVNTPEQLKQVEAILQKRGEKDG